MASGDCTESSSLRFDWTLRGLGELFENSKGENKSKVTKSPRFGGGRWQILFYANSGTANAEGNGYVSLYLSCEPTSEEKEAAIDGKWVREGVYKFGFEVRSPQKILFNTKEANDHSFSYKTVNWGWAQFARRDAIYYQSTSVKHHDAIVIVCNITSSPSPPTGPLPVTHQLVPKALLGYIGGLLDDPNYSDVEFVIPRRRADRKSPRIIYAAKGILRRVEYFDTMFRSDFAEGLYTEHASTDFDNGPSGNTASGENLSATLVTHSEDDSHSCVFEDSDDENDEDDMIPETHLQFPAHLQHAQGDESADEGSRRLSWMSVADGDAAPSELDIQGERDEEHGRNVKQKLSHPSSPRSERVGLPPLSIELDAKLEVVPGPAKLKVTVRDAAYATYRAVLFYIYTDTIVFAPLASTFHPSRAQSTGPSISDSFNLNNPRGHLSSASLSTPAATAEGPTFPNSQHPNIYDALGGTLHSSVTSRKEWIAEWERRNPDRPRLCSAKAVYRLADKLDLQELKQRAFRHIVKSLTVSNVAYEVFSDFSAAFEDVRKVEVAFFLEHWIEIRGSDAMRNVWQQIRLGRHPGFEEVWPLIALNLEFNPVRKCDDAEEEKA